MSITDTIFNFFNNFLLMCENIKNFLFATVNLGFYTFQMWQLITGGLFITFLISWLFGKVFGWGWFS